MNIQTLPTRAVDAWPALLDDVRRLDPYVHDGSLSRETLRRRVVPAVLALLDRAFALTLASTPALDESALYFLLGEIRRNAEGLRAARRSGAVRPVQADCAAALRALRALCRLHLGHELGSRPPRTAYPALRQAIALARSLSSPTVMVRAIGNAVTGSLRDPETPAEDRARLRAIHRRCAVFLHRSGDAEEAAAIAEDAATLLDLLSR